MADQMRQNSNGKEPRSLLRSTSLIDIQLQNCCFGFGIGLSICVDSAVFDRAAFRLGKQMRVADNGAVHHRKFGSTRDRLRPRCLT